MEIIKPWIQKDSNKSTTFQITRSCHTPNNDNRTRIIHNDKIKLKEEIIKILEENNAVHSKINTLANSDIIESSKAAEENEKLTNDAISKLKGQIGVLREERDTIQTLWKTSQDTISSLEKEIISYRNQLFKPNAITEIKQKYTNTIELLESTIKNVKKELDKQININKELIKGKNFIEARLRTTENKLSEREKQFVEAKNIENNYLSVKEQLETIMKSNENLENSLFVAKKLIDERFFREKQALEKVQEALLIAENAISEKEDALKREIVIREECDHLASTIGQVMEEAALKVDRDVNKLKKSYQIKIDKLKEDQKQILSALETQKKMTQRTEIRCQSLENKIKEILSENVSLETDVQVASQAIIELELKLAAIESLMDHDKKMTKVSEEREKEIEEYLRQNQHIKEKWKNIIEDITSQFEKEITLMQDENISLKAENEELKIKLMQLN
ncbi:FK506-binding protein 15-like [Condylostylus longicornis]|uniref:FK506-binding protein 15-like n=1 Tax=Condylostylus longicornis TaxID=2530218 RepID=UPI00244E4E7C|nr:FK506-binding protein 15-like [Condylostylus longicornis]